jgi:hypothetical protein
MAGRILSDPAQRCPPFPAAARTSGERCVERRDHLTRRAAERAMPAREVPDPMSASSKGHLIGNRTEWPRWREFTALRSTACGR